MMSIDKCQNLTFNSNATCLSNTNHRFDISFCCYLDPVKTTPERRSWFVLNYTKREENGNVSIYVS